MSRISIAFERRDHNPAEGFFSGRVFQQTIESLTTDYLLLLVPGGAVDYSERALERMMQVGDDSGAGIVYADFRDRNETEITDHPLIDYQSGSIRDSFDFGSLVLVSREAAQAALQKHGAIPDDLKYGGW